MRGGEYTEIIFFFTFVKIIELTCLLQVQKQKIKKNINFLLQNKNKYGIIIFAEVSKTITAKNKAPWSSG